MHTGYQPTSNIRYPEIGAIAARYLGRDDADLPNFVKVSSQGDAGAAAGIDDVRLSNIGADDL
jgi:hypothetical protein